MTAVDLSVPRRYRLAPLKRMGPWAIILVDFTTGLFAAVSDHGDYAHMWPEKGEAFRGLLLEMERDWDYLHGKLMFGRPDRRLYDQEATVAAIREEIDQGFADDADQRARELLLIGKHDVLASRLDFDQWVEETKIGDAYEMARTRPEPQCEAFCRVLYPRFVAMLRDEIAQETAPPTPT